MNLDTPKYFLILIPIFCSMYEQNTSRVKCWLVDRLKLTEKKKIRIKFIENSEYHRVNPKHNEYITVNDKNRKYN